MINGLFVFSLLVLSNVLLTNGFGALGLQRNKSNMLFALLNSFCMGLIIIACSVLYNVIYTYILDPYNLERLGILVVILLAGIFNFIVLEIIKASNKEMYYYYDTTYSFVINLGLTIGIVFTIEPMLDILETLAYAGFSAVAYIVVTMMFAFVYKRLHNKRISRLVRPVPITILTMAVLAMIIYAIAISII